MVENIGGLFELIFFTLLSSFIFNFIPFIIMILGCESSKKGKTWGWYFFAAFALQAFSFIGMISYALRNELSSSARMQDFCDVAVFLIMFVSMFLYAKKHHKVISTNDPKGVENNSSAVVSSRRLGIKRSNTTLRTDDDNSLSASVDLFPTERYSKTQTIETKTDDLIDFQNGDLDSEKSVATNTISQELYSTATQNRVIEEDSSFTTISIGDFSKQLREYRLMLDEGLINQTDYDNKKAELLNKVR